MHIYTIFILIFMIIYFGKSYLTPYKKKLDRIAGYKAKDLDSEFLQFGPWMITGLNFILFAFLGHLALTINDTVGFGLAILVFVIELIQWLYDLKVWNANFTENGTVDDMRWLYYQSSKATHNIVYQGSNWIEMAAFVYFVYVYIVNGLG